MAEIGANPAIYRTCIEFFCETLKYIFRVRFGSNAKMKTDFGKRKDKDICCHLARVLTRLGDVAARHSTHSFSSSKP